MGSSGLTEMTIRSSAVRQVRSRRELGQFQLDRVRKGRRTLLVGGSLAVVENQDFPIDNLDLHSDVGSSERIVSSDHDTAVRRVVEFANGGDGIGFEGAMEDEETSEFEVRLDLVSSNRVDLTTIDVSHELERRN